MKTTASFIAAGIVGAGLAIAGWTVLRHRPLCAGQEISFGSRCARPERFASHCESLPPNTRGICNAIITGRIRDLRELVARHRLPREQEVLLSRRVVTTFPTVSALLSGSAALPTFICRVRESTVVCVRLSSLLAFYNTELSSAILADLGSLYETYKLDTQKEILFRCPNGAWGVESASAKGDGAVVSTVKLTDRIDAILTKEKVDSLLSLCDQLKPRTPTAGAFSGVTGFEASNGGLSCLKVGADPAVENLRLIHEMLQSFRDGCAASFASGMMEGGAGADPPPDPPTPPPPPLPPPPPPTPPPPTPPGSPPTTTNPDGTTTTTEVKLNADGSTTQTQTTTDSAGKVTLRETITWGTDGTRARKEEVFNPDGTPARTLDSKYFNGTAVHISTGPGGRYEVVQFGDGQGGPPGSGGMTVSYPGGDWDILDATGRAVLSGHSVFSCRDDTCNACRSFAETTLKLAVSCGFGSGASPNPACQAFTDAASCCMQSNGPRVDPRVIIPNEGGMMCYPNVEPDIRRKSCEDRCGVASSATNCLGACLASDPSDLRPIDVSTNYCIYAYIEDECLPLFGSKEVTDAVKPPLPLPYRCLDRFVLLPLSVGDQSEPRRPLRR